MLARDLQLEDADSNATPGSKQTIVEDEQPDLLEDLQEIVNMVQIQRRASSKVTFNDDVEFLDVPNGTIRSRSPVC